MIGITVLSIVVFLSVSASAYVVLNVGLKYWGQFNVRVTETTETQLKGLYVFSDSRALIAKYYGLGLLLMVVLVLLSASAPIYILVFASYLVIPRCLLKFLVKRREERINSALPDVLVQMAAAMKAGSTFPSAVHAMVEVTEGPIAQEFTLFVREIRLGTRFDIALNNLADRIQSEDMDLIVSAVLIARDVGGNLAEVFSRLADTLRRKQEMERKIKALTAQGVLQGWVVSLLPLVILFAITYIEPEAVQALWSSVLGWGFLTVIVVLELLGGLTIRKIVSIEI